jgi:hypothetical protein
MQRVAGRLFLVNGWEVPGITSAEKFFSALPEVLTLPAKLRFEGTSIPPDLQSLCASSKVPPTLEIPRGTIWPAPAIFNVLVTESFIHELTALAVQLAEPQLFDHFHAYDDHRLLMQWYDAFLLPLFIDESVSEVGIRNFCLQLGVRYTRWRSAGSSSKRAK